MYIQHDRLSLLHLQHQFTLSPNPRTLADITQEVGQAFVLALVDSDCGQSSPVLWKIDFDEDVEGEFGLAQNSEGASLVRARCAQCL